MAAEVLQLILVEAWLSKVFPEEWTDGIIVKIPKKGNLKICYNWRGICVLPAISKIICKIILHRIKDHIYSTIDRVSRQASELDLLAFIAADNH